MSNKFDIFVIGTGGTGGYFLKEFSRFAVGNEKIDKIHIFDGDIVEEKNLKRQCFQKEDIGDNKAAVLGSILSDSFEVKIESHPMYLTSPEQLTKLFRYDHIPVVISCVDNHGARLLLEEVFRKVRTIALFDSGNEFDTGEVVFSYKKEGKLIGPPRSAYFPDMLDGDTRNRGEISCEELNQAAPQHIFTNMLAGQVLNAASCNFIENGIATPGFVYFNALKYMQSFVPYNGQAWREK